MALLTAGMRLGDRFTIQERIGVGGMSQVWRAQDEILGRPVAVKVLTAALAADPVWRTATSTEARAAARLTHPRVTQIYDYGEAVLPDGSTLPYLVMEFVDGQNLADRLSTGPMPWRQAVSTCADVAAAVAAAHRLGVVHRDIKPGNVMLTDTGAKVLDFGVAALIGSPPASDAGRLVGTPGYAAPEQLQAGAAGPESDVYALGVLLFETLCGRPPQAIGTWQEAAAVHLVAGAGPEPDVAGLPRQIRRLCSACLSNDSAERPTADQVARVLGAAAGQAGQPVANPVDDPRTAELPNAAYAVGTARLPHPPTMVDSAMSARFEQVATPTARRVSRPLLLGLAAAIVILVFALVLALVNRPTSTSGHADQPGAATTATTPSVPTQTPTPTATATSAAAIADALDALIASSVAAGGLDSEAANTLHDKINDLRDSQNQHKASQSARDLQKRVNELLRDGKIDQQTADQFMAVLQPLTGGGDG